MKFVTEAGDFLDGLKAAHSRCKGASVEILRHIKLEVAGSQLTMMGHDGSASCEAYLGVDDPVEGSCAVPGDAFVRLIGSLPKSSHVTIVLDGNEIAVRSGRSRYKIPVLAVLGFPDALSCDDAASIDLDAEQVQALFVRPRAALDPRDTRPFGQGLYLHMADGALCTSGISLFHFTRNQVTASVPELAGVNIPLAAVDEIAKICRDGGHLMVSDRTMAVEAKGRRFCSKLIEEKYPEYASRLPSVGKTYVEIDRAETLAAVRRLISIAVSDGVIDLTVGDAEVTLSLAGVGEGTETVQATSEAKIDVVLSIAAQRFIEMLEMLRGETIQLHLTKGSLAVRVFDPSDPTFILVESTRVPRTLRAAA